MNDAKIAQALERIAAATEQIATLMTKQGIKQLTEPEGPPKRRHYGQPEPEPANGQSKA